MKKLFPLLIICLACTGATYQKVDDNTVKESKTVETNINVNLLLNKKKQYQLQIADIQLKIDEIDAQLSNIKKDTDLPILSNGNLGIVTPAP